MKKLTISLLVMFTFVSLPHVAYAAISEVTWVDYDKYREIDSGRKCFRECTFKKFVVEKK